MVLSIFRQYLEAAASDKFLSIFPHLSPWFSLQPSSSSLLPFPSVGLPSSPSPAAASAAHVPHGTRVRSVKGEGRRNVFLNTLSITPIYLFNLYHRLGTARFWPSSVEMSWTLLLSLHWPNLGPASRKYWGYLVSWLHLVFLTVIFYSYFPFILIFLLKIS